MKFLLYCQHLSGAGHFVRTYEIARALAQQHEVYVVDGGLPVPRRSAPITLVPLPRIRRIAGQVVPVESGAAIESVMRARRVALEDAVSSVDPDVVVVEHFPFSKGSLQLEVVSMLEASRARAFCSLRDIAPLTRTDPVEPEETRRLLRRYFEAVLVHGDPRLITIEEQIEWAASPPVPIAYTGIVSERAPAGAGERRGDVVLSAGGGAGEKLVPVVLDAWRLLGDSVRTLCVYGSLGGAPDLALPTAPNVRFEPYGPGFLEALTGADLSISAAGYNTCANLLETRAPAIVVPRGSVSDQEIRARLLAERGLVRVMDADALDAERLANAMRDTLGRRMPRHNIDLNGAERTRDTLTAPASPRGTD